LLLRYEPGASTTMLTLNRRNIDKIRCHRCGAELDWVWEMQYESTRFNQHVHLCGACEELVDERDVHPRSSPINESVPMV
jgi:uncharacterized CHY-type Zn-finger protein